MPIASRLRSRTLQENQIERREHQDNSDVYHQPLQEVVPEEQDVHADHDGYQREHVKHDRAPYSHQSNLRKLTISPASSRRSWTSGPLCQHTSSAQPSASISLILECQCMSCQPSECRSALFFVPSRTYPAFVAT